MTGFRPRVKLLEKDIVFFSRVDPLGTHIRRLRIFG